MKLFSPVFGKEMISLSRRRSHYLCRGLLIAALFIAMWIAWQEWSASLNYRAFVDMTRLGYGLALAFMITQFFAVVILIPAMTAPIIATEKERDTLSLLLMTNLTRHNILLDKLASRATALVLLLFSGLPLFLALLAFRGITPKDIFLYYLSILGVTLFCCAVGLFFSTVMRKMASAMVSTYFALVGYFFFVMLLAENDVIDWSSINYLIPLIFMNLELHHCIVFLMFAITLFFISLSICAALLPKVAQQTSRPFIKRLFSRMNAFFKRIDFVGIKVMKESQPLKGNPVLWREIHKKFVSSNIFIFRAFYTLGAICIVAAIFVAFWDWEEIFALASISHLILMAVAALVTSSTAFSREKEDGSLSVLLSTPVTGRTMIWAKFLGVLRPLLPVFACLALWMVFCFVLSLNVQEVAWFSARLLMLMLLIVAYIPAMILIGLYASLRRKKTSKAILWTFIMFIVWCAGPPLLLLGIELLVDSFAYTSLDLLETVFYSTSPIGSIVGMLGEEEAMIGCVTLIPCWVLAFRMLVAHFDNMVGRQ